MVECIPEEDEVAGSSPALSTKMEQYKEINHGHNEQELEILSFSAQEKNIQEVFKLNPELKDQAYNAVGLHAQLDNYALELRGNIRKRLRTSGVPEEEINKLTKDDRYAREYPKVILDLVIDEDIQNLRDSYKKQREDQLNHYEQYKNRYKENEEIVPETGQFANQDTSWFDNKITELNQYLEKQKEALELYQKYLETIFPESKYKGILWHNSDNEFKDQGFKPVKPKFDTLNSIEGIYNFSTNQKFVTRYGPYTYAVVINIHNPYQTKATGEYIDDMDRPLSEALFIIGKQKNNSFAPLYDSSFKDCDSVINQISGEEYIEKHPISGKELGFPQQDIVTVFDASQIHILGSKADIEKFKEFITKKSQINTP